MSSALAEALVAAQRRALTAMEKAYVGKLIEQEQFGNLLDSIGLNDKVDKARLLQALMIIRDLGAQLPSEPTNGATEKPSDKATDAQLTLIAKLVKERNVTGPDQPLTKQDAHEIIDTLKAGTYDQNKWLVPF